VTVVDAHLGRVHAPRVRGGLLLANQRCLEVANREWLRYRPAMTKITVLDNGPLRIEGNFTICDASGKEFGLGGRTALSLCRCGKSANLPFCDGAHARTGFQSACPARDLPPPKPKV